MTNDLMTGGFMTDPCSCIPCESPGYGAPGYDHCEACCRGTLIEEYDPGCAVDEHVKMARLQHGLARLPEEVRR